MTEAIGARSLSDRWTNRDGNLILLIISADSSTTGQTHRCPEQNQYPCELQP